MAINLGVYGLFHYRKYQQETGQDPFALQKHIKNFTLNLHSLLGEGRWWTVITAGFSHTGFMHILGNLMTAYFLGRMVTTTPGVKPLQIATLILGSGIIGNLGYIFMEYQKNLKFGRRDNRFGLGFSGSVMGLGVVAAMLYPTSTVQIYGIIPVPLWVLIGGYFAYDAYYLQSGQNTGVAHAGHLGGLAFGVLYYFLSIRRGIFRGPQVLTRPLTTPMAKPLTPPLAKPSTKPLKRKNWKN